MTDDSDEVTISNISFDVDKFAIADDNTEIVDDGTSNTFKQNIENWEQAQSSDSVIQDKKMEALMEMFYQDSGLHSTLRLPILVKQN